MMEQIRGAGKEDVIRSFSEKALLLGLSSNLLYPTNASQLQKIENCQASIYETFNSLPTNALDFVERKDRFHFYGKSARIFLRGVYAKGVSTLISPLGMLYHLGRLSYYGVKHLQGGSERAHYSHKTREHAKAFFTDLVMAGLGLWSTGAIIATYKFWKEGRYFYSLFTPLMSLEVFHYAFLPHHLPRMIAYKGERAGMYKAIILRNKFGLGDANGRILSYNSLDDEDLKADRDRILTESKGMLTTLWMNRAEELLRLLKEVREKLNAHNRIIYFGNPPNGRIIAEDLELLEGLEGIIDVQHYRERFLELQKEIDFAKPLLKECLEAKFNSIFEQMLTRKSETKVQLPQFPLDWEAYLGIDDSHSYSATNKSRAWAATLATYEQSFCTEPLSQDCFTSKENYEIYLNFRAGIKAKKSAQNLLELQPLFSPSDLKKVRDKLALIFHPDKNSKLDPPKRAEKEALFKCLGNAVEELRAEINRR